MKYVVFAMTENIEYESSLPFPLYYVDEENEAKTLVEDLNHKAEDDYNEYVDLIESGDLEEQWNACEDKVTLFLEENPNLTDADISEAINKLEKPKYNMYTEQVRYFVHDIPSKEEWDALEAKETE